MAPASLLQVNKIGICGNFLKTLTEFWKGWKQRVVLNGQNSSWLNVEVGVLQSSILGPLLFYISIYDLSNNLSTNAKLFAGGSSLSSTAHNIITFTACNLNYDLNKVKELTCQWEISFNPHPSKQAQGKRLPSIIF